MPNQLAAQLTAVPMVLPPGTGQLTTIIAWVTGLAGFGLILAWIASVGKTGIEALGHGQLTGGKAMIVCLICGVMLGATGVIFGALGIQG